MTMSKSLTESLTDEILRVTEIKRQFEESHSEALAAALMGASIEFALRAKVEKNDIYMEVALRDLRSYKD